MEEKPAVRFSRKSSKTSAAVPDSMTVSDSKTSWLNRLCLGGLASNTSPPPMVTTGEKFRKIKRSPFFTATSSSKRICIKAVSPGNIFSLPKGTRRPITSRVPICK